ncbi:hypothetical protein EBU71_12325 [bacterium]|nr:hypothetical protein [Candidatus Elulimicrobium humile]
MYHFFLFLFLLFFFHILVDRFGRKLLFPIRLVPSLGLVLYQFLGHFFLIFHRICSRTRLHILYP